MYEDLEKEAKKRVEAKQGFFVTALVFSFISILLLVISFAIGGDAAFWIRFPILILMMILLGVYLATFGLPFGTYLSAEWKEDEIEREMARMYRRKRRSLPPAEELSNSDKLELEELERLQKKWGRSEDHFV